MSAPTLRVRLLFVDDGSYRHEEITIPARVLDEYDRLIDGLRESPEVLRRTWVDVSRLVSAHVVGAGEDDEEG